MYCSSILIFYLLNTNIIFYYSLVYRVGTSGLQNRNIVLRLKYTVYNLFYWLRKMHCMLNYFIRYNSYSATHSCPPYLLGSQLSCRCLSIDGSISKCWSILTYPKHHEPSLDTFTVTVFKLYQNDGKKL